MVENLKSLGFNHIYNKKEDFYKVIENNKIPEYDILITNPPYSEDHVNIYILYINFLSIYYFKLHI